MDSPSVALAERLAPAVIDSIEWPAALLSRKGRVVAVNAAWTDTAALGLTHDRRAVPGADLRHLVRGRIPYGDALAARVESGFVRVQDEGDAVFTAEHKLERLGRVHWIAVRIARVSDDSLLVTFRDVSELKSAERRASDSDALLRSVLDLLPQRVFWKDARGRYLGGNRAFKEEAGMDDVRGKTDADMPWQATAERIAQIERHVLDTGESVIDRITPVERPGAPTTWLQWSRVPIRGDDERPIGVIGAYADVSERQRYEQSMARMAREMSRLALVVRKTQNAVLISDETRLVTWVNQGFTRIFGEDSAKIIGRPVAEVLVTDRDARAELETLRNGLLAGRPFRGELRFFDREGALRWFDSDLQPIVDGTGRVTGVIGVLNDITAQVALRTAVEESEQRLTLALKSTGLATWTWDCEAHTIDGDARFLEINGLVAGALPMSGGDWLDCVLPEDRAKVSTALLSVMAGEVTAFPRFRITRPDGIVRIVDASAIPEHHGARMPARLVGIFDDVSERVVAEAEQQRSLKLESIGGLAAGIAHEINTPVQYTSDSLYFVRDAANDVLTLAKRALDAVRAADPAGGPAIAEGLAQSSDLDYLAEQMPLALDRALDGLERVARIVRSMKEFAHPDDQSMVPADLNHLVETILTMARNEYKYVAELHTDFGELPPVPCRSGDIGQVVLNIVVNAAHAIADVLARRSGESTGEAAERGRIDVRTRVDGEHALIEIADTGGGIPESIREKIFDPFFTTKDVGVGTGQGLAISRRVIEAHGGRLTFETVLGRGTTFSVRLPLEAVEESPPQDVESHE